MCASNAPMGVAGPLTHVLVLGVARARRADVAGLTICLAVGRRTTFPGSPKFPPSPVCGYRSPWLARPVRHKAHTARNGESMPSSTPVISTSGRRPFAAVSKEASRRPRNRARNPSESKNQAEEMTTVLRQQRGHRCETDRRPAGHNIGTWRRLWDPRMRPSRRRTTSTPAHPASAGSIPRWRAGAGGRSGHNASAESALVSTVRV